MNKLFPIARPSLPLFVTKIEEESRYQVKRLEDIRFGRVVPDEYEEPIIGDIPGLYLQFQAPPSTAANVDV